MVEYAELSEAQQKAAVWLAGVFEVPHPIIPHMRDNFGLSAKEAIDAIKHASDIRRRRNAT